MTIKISKAAHGIESISFCTEEMQPGRNMRIHKHLDNDEVIFIHKGQGTFTLGETLIEVKAGDVAFIPRDTWHGMNNTGTEPMLMVFQYSPAGFENFFIENGTVEGEIAKERTDDEYKATQKKFGMVYKDK